jgi:hypothetical protein
MRAAAAAAAAAAAGIGGVRRRHVAGLTDPPAWLQRTTCYAALPQCAPVNY